MKFKNAVFASPIFAESMVRLNHCNNLPMESFVEVLRFNKKLEENQVIYNKARQMLLEKYGEEKDGKWIVPEDADEKTLVGVNKEFNDLVELEFTIDMEKIPLTKHFLGEKGLLPQDVLVLNEILDDGGLVDSKPKGKKKRK